MKRKSSPDTSRLRRRSGLSESCRVSGAAGWRRRVTFAVIVTVVALAPFASGAQEETTTTAAPAETTTTAAPAETTTTAAPAETTTTAAPAETTTSAAPAETTTTAAPAEETTTTTAAPTVTVPAVQENRDDAAGGSISEDLAGALGVWNGRVRDKESELETAEARLEAAETRLETTNGQIQALQDGLAELEAEAVDRAIGVFKDRSSSGLDLSSYQQAQEANRKRTLLQNVVRSDVDVAADLRRAKEDLALEQAVANEAAAEADQARQFIAEELVDLEDARDRKASLTAAAASSLDVATEADIVTVRGFEVHREVADVVAAMVDAAAEAGLDLGGGGYRSFESQIEIRKNNCGTSHYAVWEMPSRNCSPPTARPGASMHERGLALDFTCSGSLIRSRNNPCFRWLAASAEGFGFFNLPSEPWHWSVNGR